MFFIIKYENGSVRTGTLGRMEEIKNYAESCNGGWDYEIAVYDNYADFQTALQSL